MASTAAASAPSLLPRPTQRAAASAADSVTRTSSIARLRSGRCGPGLGMRPNVVAERPVRHHVQRRQGLRRTDWTVLAAAVDANRGAAGWRRPDGAGVPGGRTRSDAGTAGSSCTWSCLSNVHVACRCTGVVGGVGSNVRRARGRSIVHIRRIAGAGERRQAARQSATVAETVRDASRSPIRATIAAFVSNEIINIGCSFLPRSDRCKQACRIPSGRCKEVSRSRTTSSLDPRDHRRDVPVGSRAGRAEAVR